MLAQGCANSLLLKDGPQEFCDILLTAAVFPGAIEQRSDDGNELLKQYAKKIHILHQLQVAFD